MTSDSITHLTILKSYCIFYASTYSLLANDVPSQYIRYTMFQSLKRGLIDGLSERNPFSADEAGHDLDVPSQVWLLL